MKNGCLCAMLDCSRNAVMHLDALKKFIKFLSSVGYNALQLYTEDTYEIDGEPLFGYMRGRYTAKELREADEFAKHCGVELIPCIQTLGHLDQLFSWKRFQTIQDIYNILLAGDENTYNLIDKMMATCAACFTSRRINIGMDEAHMTGLGKYLDRNGYTPRAEILAKHLERVCAIAEKYGFKPMMWSDLFFNGYKSGADSPACAVSAKTDLIYWDYEPTEREHYSRILQDHQALGRKIWFAGCVKTGRTFNAANEKYMKSLSASLAACKEQNVNNVIITVWGDYGNECLTSAVLPSLTYAACVYHGESEMTAKRKFEKVTGEKWDDFLALDMKMPESFPKKTPYDNAAKTMLYSDCFSGRYDSMVFGDGREKKEYARMAEKFAEISSRSRNYSGLFDLYRRLCEILSVKYDLGYLTRLYYQSGETGKLQSLLPDYTRLIPMLEEFVDVYGRQWRKENKPQGFDVLELRLGGLIRRIKSCAKRLEAYLKGTCSGIDELEEKLVYDAQDDLLCRKMADVGNYTILATVNRV